MKITIQAGINTYRIAGRTTPVNGIGVFQGRLLSELRITKQLARIGNAPLTLPINIRNNDAFIASSVDLWGASVSVESDSGYTWQGKITAYDSDGGGVMYIVATEKTAPELLVKFPDEVARLVTVDENFHVSALNVTLPMVVGGTVEKPILVKGILIEKTAGIYLLCVGENHQIVNVYRGTEKLTSGFVAYTGTAAQENYPGFAYVQLIDESLRKNDDGTYVEVSAEVVGLKLGTHTVEECRNGARFLLWLLKTAREGAGGWGLGIAEADIDATAFTTAISRVDTAGLKMDGIFYFRQIAQSWIDQICQATRGSYSIGSDGKRRLFVNAPSASRKTYTKHNIKLLRYGKGAYTGQVYNKGRLEFGYNPLVGQFTQSAQYEDPTSISDIDEQLFEGQSYLIREMATGKALVDYVCKKSLIGATKIYFETKELPDDCHEGDIITVYYPEKGISGDWQITHLDIGDRKHRIEAEKFSDTIFVSGTPGTAIDWSQDPPIVAPFLPGAPTGLDLSTAIDYDSAGDGAARPFIEGTFTPPEGKYLGAAVFWGEGADPATWNAHGSIRGTTFRVGPVKAGQLYTVKVQLFNSSGASTAITGSIVGGSHTELPPAPTVTASSGLGCIVVNISVAAFSALAGFDIQRQTSAGADNTTVVSSFRGTRFTDDSPTILDAYGTYQYRVRSVSNSRQPSAWSAWTSDVSATQSQSKDITANQIIAKDFRTACNAGNGTVSGVLFNASGIQAWNGATNTFCINAATGDVGITGTITACSGVIGGWSITPDKLCKTITNGCLVLGMNQGHGIQWAEYHGGLWSAITLGQCVWTGSYVARTGLAVTFDGVQYFGVHKPMAGGTTCAVIAGWNFNATQIYSTGCGLILCNTGAIQTGVFTTGNKGWKIDSVGNAEFNNICARGAIRTAVFIKDQISVVGGCTMIRPASILSADDVYSASSNIYYVDDNTQFAVNDIIRIKSDVDDFWGKVTASATGCITVGYCNGNTSGNITKGQAIVNYGSCLGCGGIMLNGQCPYIDLYTHAGLPWNGTESRVRIGNLAGWGSFDTLTPTYGIAAGCPTGQYMTYDSVSGVLDIAGNINVKSTLPLVMPAGAVGEWVAKGSTTASIAVAGGVIDISGNGNHGQAFGGVTVSDSIIGKVFQFDNASKYIDIPPLGSDAPWTVSAWVARSAFANASWKTIIGVASGPTSHLVLDVNYAVGLWDGSHKLFGYVVPDDGQFHALTVIYHNSTSASLYADGVFVSTITINLNLNTYKFSKIGNWSGGGYHAGHIGNLKIYNRALTAAEVKTLYLLGKDTESGTITAERIKTGVMSSLNWSASAGSCFNMDNGTFVLGGSLAPKLSWNGTTLNVVGNITIAAGSSGIANFTDANIDNIADGSTYKRTTQNEKTGAGRAYSGLDASNRLTTAVIPGTTLAPTTAGLFIGSNNLGYHNGTEWRTYMGSNGNFYLGGTGANKGLAWDALNNCLTVCGCITSCAGTIGGWTLSNGNIIKTGIGGVTNRKLEINASQASIHWWQGNASSGAFLGQIYKTAWTGRYGLAVVYNNASIFEASYDTANSLCAQIAGWNFNANCLYSNNILINNNGSIYSNNYSAGSAGWCINGAGAAEFNSVTVRGTICSCSGTIGGMALGACGIGLGDYFAHPKYGSNYTYSSYLTRAYCNGSYDTGLNIILACADAFSCPPWKIITCISISGSTGSGYDTSNPALSNAPITICTMSTSYYAFATNSRIVASAFCVVSDRAIKTDIQRVSVLSALRQMPVTKWRFCDSPDYQIGPMAQDFNCVFRLSHDWQTNLTVGGLDGIALRGVQELDECVAYNNRRILDLESRNACLETQINCITKELLQLKAA